MHRRWLVAALLVALAVPAYLALRPAAVAWLGGGCEGPAAYALGRDGVALELEVASTPAERARGLMFRPELPWNRGMLFVFEAETTAAFWMRNTSIPLSIAFIAADGTILDVKDMEPLDETPAPPAAPYRYALEVNQGWYAAHGLGPGDRLLLCFAGGPLEPAPEPDAG